MAVLQQDVFGVLFMISIRIISDEQSCDINIPNEPFPLFGRMIPSYINERWEYKLQYFEEDLTYMCFPDESYDFDSMKDEHTFIGAYDSNKCIGLAILRQGFLKYMYLYDLKVNAAYRGNGVGKMLIEKAKEIAAASGYRGLYAQAQDNNLGACLFYLNTGFYIGGFDSNVYRGTSQEGKSDIIFYADF